MPRAALLLLPLLLGCAPAARPSALPSADDDATYAELRRELAAANAAHRANDPSGLLAHAERAVKLRPSSVGALYTLACAHALLGQAEAMRAPLEQLARLRVYFDLDADPDFAPVHASPLYAQARARMAALLTERVGESQVAFTLRERDLLTEGLAYDPASGAFFVSSVHKRKIVRVGRDGQVGDFVVEGRDGLWGVFALAVDGARRSLYALSAPVEEMRGYDRAEAGATGVFEYDLDTAALKRKVVLPPAGKPRAFNDLVIARDGTLYIGDGRTGAVDTLAVGASRVEPFVPAGVLGSAQGLAFAPDGRALYVADYGRGLARIELATRKVRFLVAPPDLVLGGIDGLVATGDRLIATQNGVRPPRVIALSPSRSGDRIEAWKLLALNDPRVEEPTLGQVIDGHFFYIANSQWERFSSRAPANEAVGLAEPTILSVPLK